MASNSNPQLSQADAAIYNKLKQEYGQIFKVYTDLEDEKKEHNLVQEAIKELEPERKAWRLVGSAMVERNVGEILPALKQNIELIEKTVTSYASTLKAKEKEIMDFELKHGIMVKQGENANKAISEVRDKTTGVLT